MKKYVILLLMTISCLNGFCQIRFEKGYFIDNSDNKTTILIKNVDWKNNPSEFQYKLSENDEKHSATIASIKEFGVEGRSKYQRYKVNIDRSTNALDKLSSERSPIFNEEQLFLKVLIEGKANLYLYEDADIVRFFYKMETGEIEQLVYKRYMLPGNKIGENQGYKQQLWNSLSSLEIELKQLENLEYNRKELEKFFSLYNSSQNAETVRYDEKKNKNLIHLNVRPGISRSSLSINNATNKYYNFDFDETISYRVGLEGEFLLPFNKNKWSIIIEPTYQIYKAEYRHIEQRTFSTRSELVEMNYTSIEVPFGVRHYFFLSEKSKIFLNFSYIVDFSFGSKVEFERRGELEVGTSDNVGFGLGYKHGKKFSVELRQTSNRDLVQEYLYWYSSYRTTSLIFGYTLF